MSRPCSSNHLPLRFRSPRKWLLFHTRALFLSSPVRPRRFLIALLSNTRVGDACLSFRSTFVTACCFVYLSPLSDACGALTHPVVALVHCPQYHIPMLQHDQLRRLAGKKKQLRWGRNFGVINCYSIECPITTRWDQLLSWALYRCLGATWKFDFFSFRRWILKRDAMCQIGVGI
jgi:hypothetical protein